FGRCFFASSEKTLLISRNVFQSLFDCQGGEIAALNGCTNGWRSVLLISNFSYHVAAGSTISESSPELVIRKSTLTKRSTLPVRASSVVFTTSGCHECSLSDNIWSSAPIKYLAKYS